MKNKKNKYMIIILLIGIAMIIVPFMGNIKTLSVGGPYYYSMNKPCYEALPELTNGANMGECYVKTQNNVKTVVYVTSVVEKIFSYGGVDNQLMCIIDGTASNYNLVFTCETAKEEGGVEVQVCQNNYDCYSERCVNHMCMPGEPRSCGIVGSTKCIDENRYQECLSSTRWSGILYCPANNKCTNGECITTTCNPGEEVCVNDVLFKCNYEYKLFEQGRVVGKCGFTASAPEPTCEEKGGTECLSNELCSVTLTSSSNTQNCCTGFCSIQNTVPLESETNLPLIMSIIAGIGLIGLFFYLKPKKEIFAV